MINPDAIDEDGDRLGTIRWFGDPWPSGVCYTESGKLKESARIEPPSVAATCPECWAGFTADVPEIRSGIAMPYGHGLAYYHLSCFMRTIIGYWPPEGD